MGRKSGVSKWCIVKERGHKSRVKPLVMQPEVHRPLGGTGRPPVDSCMLSCRA